MSKEEIKARFRAAMEKRRLARLRACRRCGGDFEASRPSHVYCGAVCQRAANVEAARTRRHDAQQRICQSCFTHFAASRADAYYCSRACRQAAYRDRAKALRIAK